VSFAIAKPDTSNVPAAILISRVFILFSLGLINVWGLSSVLAQRFPSYRVAFAFRRRDFSFQGTVLLTARPNDRSEKTISQYVDELFPHRDVCLVLPDTRGNGRIGQGLSHSRRAPPSLGDELPPGSSSPER
jgi:hypothetical protein